jgi:hypothetical protein
MPDQSNEESPPPLTEPTLHEARPENTDNHVVNQVNHTDNLSSHNIRDSKGWDGKLRIDRSALIKNSEALSDPEYSDDENVLLGQEIDADEGMFCYLISHVLPLPNASAYHYVFIRPSRRRKSEYERHQPCAISDCFDP